MLIIMGIPNILTKNIERGSFLGRMRDKKKLSVQRTAFFFYFGLLISSLQMPCEQSGQEPC